MTDPPSRPPPRGRVLSRADRRILEVLQHHGRIPNNRLAEEVGMAASPCLRRVRALEQDGIIKGYGARISRRGVGFGVLAYVQVNLGRHTDDVTEQFRAAVDRMDAVTECHALTGDYDFLLRVVARDLDDLGDTVLRQLLRLPGIQDIRSSIVLNTVKEAPPVPVNLTGAA